MGLRNRSPKLNNLGQATTEYVLLLLVVVGAYAILFRWINEFRLADMLTKPLTDTYAKVYKYGHPKAKGYDEGTPENHPRAGNGTTRMFINPRAQ